MEWQPIETAPVDESVLCAFMGGIGIVIAHLKSKDGDWIGDSGTIWPRRFIVAWMPLPEPPEAA